MPFKKLFLLLYSPLLVAPIFAQSTFNEDLATALDVFFSDYRVANYLPAAPIRLDSFHVDEESHRLTLFANESFCSQPFTQQSLRTLYNDLRQQLPQSFTTYSITIVSPKGRNVETLVPNFLRETAPDSSRLWGDIDRRGNAWVTNLSRPYGISQGLEGRHLMIWPSHGRYYKTGVWAWQRPNLFCTTEDLFTQSFVYPFLFPMLENAGAIVYSARERDRQTAEVIVDNDIQTGMGMYAEVSTNRFRWETAPDSGFAPPLRLLTDESQPFRSGTARQVKAGSEPSQKASATWLPYFPQRGEYAVYVSYQTLPNSVSDARYTVYHAGERTVFRVNQQMGGSTWVYLGTFLFEAGQSSDNCVVLTNQSNEQGIVTADGIRFGGGMGQVERGIAGTSGLPRFLEAARYQAQWCGLPDSLYNTEQGLNDYNDDLRARSNLLNRLAGGSVFMPNGEGQKVPFELSLAVHSDAGIRADNSIYGSLAICTTSDSDGQSSYPAGISRLASFDLADMLLTTLTDELSQTFRTNWTRRELWDRNYSETRAPHIPSAILEILSHQNFGDMKFGHDPNFKFALSRSLYKALLRYVNYQHGCPSPIVQPLPVRSFAAVLNESGTEALLSWQPTLDSLEANAAPTGYILYTRRGQGDFDNGQMIVSGTSCSVPLQAGIVYSFKISALNAGGVSFPSEVLSVYRAPNARKTMLIVNGFERLSGPATIERGDSLGFDLQQDLGVPYRYTTAFSGAQINFNAYAAGGEGPDGLGYCGSEWVGRQMAGNTFDFVAVHAYAAAATGLVSFGSCSKSALEEGLLATEKYDVIDYFTGLEKDVPYNLKYYRTFPEKIQTFLRRFTRRGGKLLVSGAYIGSDMLDPVGKAFTSEVLKYRYGGSMRTDSATTLQGLNLQFSLYRLPNEVHYAAVDPDVIEAADGQAFTAVAYADGRSAGIAYDGTDYKVISLGFPFECIRNHDVQQQAMRAFLHFLLP